MTEDPPREEAADIEPAEQSPIGRRRLLIALRIAVAVVVVGAMVLVLRGDPPRRAVVADATTGTAAAEADLIDPVDTLPPADDVTDTTAPQKPPAPRRPRLAVNATITLPSLPPLPAIPIPTSVVTVPPAPVCPRTEGWSASELGVYAISTAGGAPGRKIMPYSRGTGEPQDFTYSPESKQLAFTRVNKTDGSREHTSLHLANADGTSEREILPETIAPTNPLWSPDGTMLAFRDYESEPARIGFYVLDLQTMAKRRVAESDQTLGRMQWSPDSTRLAWSNRSDSAGGLWVADVATASSKRLTQTKTWEVEWSPTGSEIAATRLGGGAEVMNADGSNRRMVDPEAIRVAWSPVDRSALITDTGGILRWADPDGGGVRHFVYSHLHGWQKDGRHLVTTSIEGIHVIDLNGCINTLVAGSGSTYGLRTWSPDGTDVLFVRFQ